LNAPLHVILFGIGLGGSAGDYSAFISAISRQFGLGMWNQGHYLTDSGFLFHNFYADVLIAQGILGVLVLIYIIFKVWKIINYCCANNILLKKSFHLYWIGFLLMNYYRWSASCGIAEIIVLSLILKKVYQEHKSVDKSESIKKNDVLRWKI
jgi:O-antigen ligase